MTLHDLRRAGLRLSVATSLLLAAACGGSSPTPPTGDDDDDTDVDLPIAIPSRGTATTLDVATWNLEWFGDSGNGPVDDDFQRRRVRDVILGAEVDIWALQEVVDAADFEALLNELPGYDGILATDAQVMGGAASYSDFGGNEQKVALIWRTEDIAFVSAEIVLSERDFDFAGRPPMEVRAHAAIGEAHQDLVLLILHAKASTDADSWTRRRDAAAAMKSYLDADYPDAQIYVLGDFNDDVDVSIREGSPSPYADFVTDPERWRFATGELSAAGATSTVGYSDMIDHILVSNEAAAGYEAGSAEVFRVDAYIQGYGTNTSDHFPVLARFRLGG